MRFLFAHDEKNEGRFPPFPIFYDRGQTKNALLVQASFPGFVALALAVVTFGPRSRPESPETAAG